MANGGSAGQAIANNINTSLSSSEQVVPNFWTDPVARIPYYITVQAPEHQARSDSAWCAKPGVAMTRVAPGSAAAKPVRIICYGVSCS